MPRTPNPSSGKSLTIHAKTLSDEEKIRAYKEIHARNEDLKINASVMGHVDNFLKRHNWPPGNSQTLMSVFTEQKKIQQKCGREGCEESAIGKAEAKNGWQGFLCQRHYRQSRDARLLRKWRKLK